MSISQNEELFQSLLEWLEENGYQFNNIHSDERGYFVHNLIEVGHPAEDGARSADIKKVYLPAKYQELSI